MPTRSLPTTWTCLFCVAALRALACEGPAGRAFPGAKLKKQHFSTRCLDNSYRCSLRNYTPHVHEEEWLEVAPPLRLGCSCSSDTLCPDRRPSGLTQYM